METNKSKFIEVCTPEMAAWILSFLFQKYASIQDIQDKYSGGLIVFGPGEQDDDHDKYHGEHRILLVIAGRKK